MHISSFSEENNMESSESIAAGELLNTKII